MRFLRVQNREAEVHFRQTFPGEACLLVPEALRDLPAHWRAASHIVNDLMIVPARAPKDRAFQPEPALLAMTEGRKLLLDEVTSVHPLEIVDAHVKNGWLLYERATPDDSGGCPRCGSVMDGEIPHCARCGRRCRYCRDCIQMGRISMCSLFVVSAERQEPKKRDVTVTFHGTLTGPQERSSSYLVNEVTKGAPEVLCWAVCGAGKTEMLFPLIRKTLSNGEPVMIATPRADVVKELVPRLQSAFPEVRTAGFYGDCPDRYAAYDLAVATTHQAMRFKDAFPLIIIDEVDAFPFTVDERLGFAVNGALRSGGSIVYLTATPSKVLRKRAEQGELPFTRVPRRFHGHPLPEPKAAWVGDWKRRLKKGRLPQKVMVWLKARLQEERPAFLFVPEIALLDQVVAAILKGYPVLDPISVTSVHAKDDKRGEKVQGFRSGAIRIIVTTTILERGVTVPGAQVAVLGAEDAIFDEAALVQMAGRAGRSKDAPDGDVVFFHHGRTMALNQAISHIRNMNMEGGEA
ncbi:DEAD/DEAH box helicase [Salisediminibacterium selenitireducens]|uniref:Helicase domain protein n=1 Tax=Bacillus selenitireducens (strain ATCC 700615 / DSM 15326 / MLS10) TaxID=439292 RepID=D6Y0F0_BACIE|nr:helicase-related protein [Salisediminibacterium selenitireducens]ADH98541.1 helicase domain protein [[Bacillus] selenitireducens MLS10]